MAAGPKRQPGWKTAKHVDRLDFPLVWAEESLEAVRKGSEKES